MSKTYLEEETNKEYIKMDGFSMFHIFFGNSDFKLSITRECLVILLPHLNRIKQERRKLYEKLKL